MDVTPTTPPVVLVGFGLIVRSTPAASENAPVMVRVVPEPVSSW
jgi:hypothetical protein